MQKRPIWKRPVSFSLLGMLFALSTFLSACGSGSSVNSDSIQNDGNGQKVIHIGYQKNDPLMILKERRTLEKRLKSAGVKVKWTEFQDGPALLEALNAGSLDLGRTGETPPIFAQAAGSSLVYIAVGKTKSKGSGILVRKNSSIHSLSDLKGKTIGFSKGTSSHYLVVKALNKAGLKFTDIHPAYLKPGDARVAFEQGKIDAWVVWDPYTADAQNTMDARLLVDGEGLITDRDFFLTSEAYAKNHSDILKMVMEEVQKSSEWTNHHQKEAAAMLSDILKIDPSSMLMAIKRREYGVDKLTPDIIQEQQEIADTFYRLKMIPKKVDVKQRMHKLE